jgi:predicted ribosome quality control (RQC) complex YloA/Tae2 family protein
VFLGNEKPALPSISALGMRLRKYWENGSLEKIEALEGERIVRMVISTRDAQYHVYVELFGKGNVVVCDSSEKILIPWRSQSFSARLLKRGELYETPPERSHLFMLDDNAFFEKLHTIERNVSTTLAKQGLGRKYATEVCVRAEVDPLASSVGRGEMQKLYEEVVKLLHHDIEASVIDGDVEPFMLESVDATRENKESFSAALYENADWDVGPSPYEEEIERVATIIREQKKTVNKLSDYITEQTKKAELLYGHYEMVKEILLAAKEAKDVDAAMAKYPAVKKVDQKNKKIVLELD